MNHIIEPERLGLWIAVTFIIALLALCVSVIGLTRNTDLMYMTQAEALLLNHKINEMNPVPAQSSPEKSKHKQFN